MTKEKLYYYLGTNGSILSPVFLPTANGVEKMKLTADKGKELTRDDIHFYPSIVVAADEVDNWKEVKGQK